MELPILVLLILAPLPLYFLYTKMSKHLTRKKLRHTPFPTAWEEILMADFPLYQKLPTDLQQQLNQRVEYFIAEKHFEGCEGFEITDEVRVLVAAQACMLLLNTPHRIFPHLTTILIYPSTYIARETISDGTLQTNQATSVAGQSSGWGGQVILAWNHVKGGAQNSEDGHNVVFHEFAHQLDSESGTTNGVPYLSQKKSDMYRPWLEIVGSEFSTFLEKVEHHRKDVIDEYGATNGPEFFAVVTETFFEKPHQLYKSHKSLFEVFEEFYGLDPRDW